MVAALPPLHFLLELNNMQFIASVTGFLLICSAATALAEPIDIDALRKAYSKPPAEWPKPTLEPNVAHNEIGLLPEVTFPKGNPYSTKKMRLGEKLYFDPKLSRSGQIACASCHDQDLGWADGRTLSFGHDRQKGKRNAPAVENTAFWHTLFWDGRAESLEQQALMPIQDPVEMNFTLPELEARLNKLPEYQQAFLAVFGDPKVTSERIGKALATYQRTLVSRRSDFDAFLLAPNIKNERLQRAYNQRFSNEALLGLHLFRTKAGCMNCHAGPLFSDNQFHNIGLTYYKREYEDLGRYNVTGKAEDVGKFKTPSLRGVMNTGPWMHNGLFGDIRGILNIYNAGGVPIKKDPNDPLSPETSVLLKPLQLTENEMNALEAFLQSITASPAGGPQARFLIQERDEKAVLVK